MVDLVPVGDAYTAEAFQEFPRMAGIARLLVFVQDDLPAAVHAASAVYPHVALRPCRAPVLIYKDRCLVCLQYMITIHYFMKVIIQDCEVPVCTLDRPVCHILTGNGEPVTLKFLFLAVKGTRIHILGIYDCGFHGRGYQTAFKQACRMPGPDNGVIRLCGIYGDMMFLNLYFCRGKPVPAVNLVGEAFVPVLPKCI